MLVRGRWHADDGATGLPICGCGAPWDLRDTPFSVNEAVGPAGASAADGADGAPLHVGRGISSG